MLTSKTFEHKGIKIELLGIIEILSESGSKSQFISLSKELEPAGTLYNQVNKFKFAFNNVEKSYETYHGVEVNCKYILKLIIQTTFRSLAWEREIGVAHPQPKEVLKVLNDPIKLEVGIDNWLHVSFEIDKTKYGTKDIITGRVIYKKTSFNLKSMQLQIIRRETIIGSYVDNTMICRYEIMDGAPEKNETIPIRFFLSPYELTPSYPNVNNKFSVQYFLNLVIYDINDQRFFKQQELQLLRVPRYPFKAYI